jgi:Transposase and inactivated derivatives
MGISRQAHYKGVACQREKSEQQATVIEMVKNKRQRQPRLGTRKLHDLLQEPMQQAGIKLGRDGMFDLLRQAHLLVPPKRAYHKTTHSHHHLRRHPNLLKAGVPGQVQPTGCEQLWVADITYLPTRDKTVYLSLVTDAYSRKIVGWHVHASLQAEEVSQALRMALRGRKMNLRLVHHSDRGVQYCSSHYQELHRRHGITCSMTDGYDCYQNALAERVNGILKTELLLHRPAHLQQAVRMVREAISIYNEERPHDSLKKKMPAAVHRASLAAQQEREFAFA